MGSWPYDPQRLVGFNYIDAMALVAKEAWVTAGGYDHVRFGWEDYDFWCRLAEIGLRGIHVTETLAEYRVHGSSMIRSTTTQPENMRILMNDMSRRHPWLALVKWGGDSAPVVMPSEPSANLNGGMASARLTMLLPLLRCPETGLPLVLAEGGASLRTPDGARVWPVLHGRPVLVPGMISPEVKPDVHISNDLPESALALIRETHGLVLNLSGGGTKQRFENVVEAEAAIFRHTDLVADSHHLPFADESFEAVVALNAFEHYRDPRRAALEIRRVLRPGGRVLIRTAFLQPQHEAPWHFFNCTRHGLEEWFKDFECERLHVSDNFTANYSLSWLASECEAALRRDVSNTSADAFLAAPAGRFVNFWRDPTTRESSLWADFSRLSHNSQETIAAGFEYLGRRPVTES
jgi:SAM-dependent methyltransferase